MMKPERDKKVRKGLSQIRRTKSNLKNVADDLETDKESDISDFEDRMSQQNGSKSFSSSSSRSIHSYSKNSNNRSTTGGDSILSDDPLIATSNGIFSRNTTKKNHTSFGLMQSSNSTQAKRTARMNLSGISNFSQSDASSIRADDSFCMSLNGFRQRDNGLFDEDNDAFDDLDADNDEEEDLTPEEKTLMEKWMHIFQRMLKNRIKEEDAFEYLLEEELSLAQYSWNHSATILATISKIYSLKVDRLCHESYHLLASLARGTSRLIDDKGLEQPNQIQEINTHNMNSEEKRKQESLHYSFYISCFVILQGRRKGDQIEQGSFVEFVAMYENGKGDQRQIMKADKMALLNRVDIEFDVDPLFRKTSQCFDASSSSGLLLNILPLVPDIVLSLGEIEIEKRSYDNEGGDKNESDNEWNSIWKSIRESASGILGIDSSIEVLPELVDFKVTVNQEQAQLNRQVFKQSQQQMGMLGNNNISGLNTKKDQEPYATSIFEDNNESDKRLMDEIEFTLAYDVLGAGKTAIKGRQSSGGGFSANSMMMEIYTPVNMNRLGQFEADQQFMRNTDNNFGQLKYDDDEVPYVSTLHDGSDLNSSSSPPPSFSSGFDASSLNSSMHQLGKGDKSMLSPVCMNLNWGDPKQWELQKPQIGGRLSKKTRFKTQNTSSAGGLGEIREDMMEGDDHHNIDQRNQLNAEYQLLTNQAAATVFDFTIDLEDPEVFDKVMEIKGKKKKQNNVRFRKEQLNDQIKQRNCLQKDHKITTERVFRMGLRNMSETGQPNNKIMKSRPNEGEYANDVLDFLERSLEDNNNNDIFEYDQSQFSQSGKINRRASININPLNYTDNQQPNYFSTQGSGLSPSSRQHHAPNFEYRTAIKGSQFYSQSQTAFKRRNVKIQELKETVWTCMTASKNSQDHAYSLQPLSQFTTAVKEETSSGGGRNKKKRDNNNNINNSFLSVFVDSNNKLEGSIKFTDVMTQLPNSQRNGHIGGEYDAELSLAQQGVSIQNCFISLLHLANEKSLRLIDPSHSEAEFFIFEDDQGGQDNNNQ